MMKLTFLRSSVLCESHADKAMIQIANRLILSFTAGKEHIDKTRHQQFECRVFKNLKCSLMSFALLLKDLQRRSYRRFFRALRP